METKHTPGPWNVSKTLNDYAIYPKNTSNKDIAAVYKDSRGIPEDEALANVKLIAAAPCLLEACKAAKSSWEYNSDIKEMINNFDPNLFDIIEEAIQKTTE